MQKLIMPFKRQMMLCGYKNAQYKSYWGYNHFGVDVSTIQGGAGDDPVIYASGDGIVLAAGMDTKLGYGLAILYPDAYNHKTKKTQSLTARYMHMRSIRVQAGDKVHKGQAIGVEGKEGTKDYHLHLEFDSDTAKAYATWSPQVAGGSFWKKGFDTTVNPSDVLYVGKGQDMAEPIYNPAWLNPEDFVIPNDETSNEKPDSIPVPREDDGAEGAKICAECARKEDQIKFLLEDIKTLHGKIAAFEEKMRAAVKLLGD